MVYWNNSYQPAQDNVMQSKYHTAYQKNMRLHNSWCICKLLWRRGDLKGMNHEFENVWSELEADATPGQRKFFEKISKVINESFTKHVLSKNYGQRVQTMNRISELLRKKRYFLFRVEKAQGLGKKYKEEDEDLF